MTDARPGVGRDNARWVRRGAPNDPIAVDVHPGLPGWTHTGLQVHTLEPGADVAIDGLGVESIVVPLAGGGPEVDVAGPDGSGPGPVSLVGRADVFAGPTDVLYLPSGVGGRLSNPGSTPLRVAVCAARVPAPSGEHAVRHVPAAQVPVELRGAGRSSREVRNFGIPDVLGADRIIACEVLTPAGNWSSYPPHKHDEEIEGLETELEEIYYFEARATSGAGESADASGYQQVYGTAERPIDVLAQVRTGDVVLVPHGWHGPAAAGPGSDLYYLNVMAGPGPTRAWLISDDPQHGWVRAGWSELPVDARLPFGATVPTGDGEPRGDDGIDRQERR